MITGKKVRSVSKQNFVNSPSRASLTPGKMLSIVRKKNALSQGQLAAAAGLTQSTVSSLESDRIKLGAERARALARVLHVHPAVLLFPDWTEQDLAA